MKTSGSGLHRIAPAPAPSRATLRIADAPASPPSYDRSALSCAGLEPYLLYEEHERLPSGLYGVILGAAWKVDPGDRCGDCCACRASRLGRNTAGLWGALKLAAVHSGPPPSRSRTPG